jgi:DNA-binding CsgD family transcriptional regulator
VVTTTDAFLPFSELRKSDSYQTYCAPLHADHGMGANIGLGDGRIFTVFAVRSHQKGAFGRAEVERCARLLPHLQRAVHLAGNLEQVDLQRAAALETLEALRLCVSRGELCASTAAETQALRKMLAETRSIATGEYVAGASGLAIPRPDGKPPLAVFAFPLRMHGWRLGARRPAVAVFVSIPGEEEAGDPALPAKIFAFTPAEAAVASLVGQGHGLRLVAERLGVSLNTAHFHLQRIFEKTGTHRQAELVRLLGTLPAFGGTGPKAGK